MHAIYPLFDIKTDSFDPKDITDGIRVLKNDVEIDKLYSVNLSKEDKHHIENAELCLSIDKNRYSPKKASIAFIISCRLLKNSKVLIRYRIDDDRNIVSKIRDDYSHVESENLTPVITDQEFKTVSTLFCGLTLFETLSIRASNAVYFLSLAYRSNKWPEALLFHVNALETITSSVNRENRITKKFVNRINNFIGYDPEALKSIYDLRSELVHGRLRWNSGDEIKRLLLVAEEVCRSVFKKLLLDNCLLASFRNDEERMKLFGDG